MQNNQSTSPQSFSPVRKRGLILQCGIAFFLLTSSGMLFWLAFQERFGTFFLLFLLVGVLLLVPAAGMLYRAYALLHARYILERDGLRLRWGLRTEDIPLPEVEWVRPVSDLTFSLPLPRMSYPGAVLGTRQVEGLGLVEFIASEPVGMLLVATAQRIYAISPSAPAEFLSLFARIIEMGSLTPIDSLSVKPAFFIRLVWSDHLARWSILSGLSLSLILLVYCSLTIPRLSEISLGFDAVGIPLDPLPPDRLLLLPVLGLISFAGDLLSGLYFFRQSEMRLAAIFLWIMGICTPLMLLLVAWIIT